MILVLVTVAYGLLGSIPSTSECRCARSLALFRKDDHIVEEIHHALLPVMNRVNQLATFNLGNEDSSRSNELESRVLS